MNARRIWTSRLLLESVLKPDNAFVTLTLNTENLTLTDSGRPTLHPLDLTLFLKRLRERFRPRVLRFYGVGEYGEQTGRPHYHVILFGFPCCSMNVIGSAGCSCTACSMIADAWGLGHFTVGNVTRESCQYTAGYVLKKMTQKDDMRLDGRFPEFSRSSRQGGGIGAGAMAILASDLLRSLPPGSEAPAAIRFGGQLIPLGRYLRNLLRVQMGSAKGASVEEVEEIKVRVSAMLDDKVEGEGFEAFFRRRGEENEMASVARRSFNQRRRKI